MQELAPAYRDLLVRVCVCACSISVLDLFEVFIDSNFNGDLSAWDTARVTAMNQRTCCAHCVGGGRAKWHIPFIIRAIHFFEVFERVATFNSDLSTWDTSSVTILSNGKAV